MDNGLHREICVDAEMPRSLLHGIACCIAITALMVPGIASAEGVTTNAQATDTATAAATTPATDAAAAPVTTVCLTGAVRGGSDDKRQFAVVAPADKAAELRGRGFVDAPCASVAKVSAAKKQKICETAQIRDPALLLLYWQRYAMTPQEMCQTVEPATN